MYTNASTATTIQFFGGEGEEQPYRRGNPLLLMKTLGAAVCVSNFGTVLISSILLNRTVIFFFLNDLTEALTTTATSRMLECRSQTCGTSHKDF